MRILKIKNQIKIVIYFNILINHFQKNPPQKKYIIKKSYFSFIINIYKFKNLYYFSKESFSIHKFSILILIE